MYMQATMVIDVFRTPFQPFNALGNFIWFSKGSTRPIPLKKLKLKLNDNLDIYLMILIPKI